VTSSAGLLLIAPCTVRPDGLAVCVVECSTSLGLLEIQAPGVDLQPAWLTAEQI
jgi:hypothetical protein